MYEPTAFVWHRHRDTADGARSRRSRSYYSGHVAHQLTTLVRDRDPRAVNRLARVDGYAVSSRVQSLVGRGPVPAAIARAQLRGTAARTRELRPLAAARAARGSQPRERRPTGQARRPGGEAIRRCERG